MRNERFLDLTSKILFRAVSGNSCRSNKVFSRKSKNGIPKEACIDQFGTESSR